MEAKDGNSKLEMEKNSHIIRIKQSSSQNNKPKTTIVEKHKRQTSF